MRNLPFTLRQLAVFNTLCETQSFRKCADELGISQASVSSQIKALEHQLGASLFTRLRGKQPTLTPSGVAFRRDLTGFYEAADKLAQHRRQSLSETEKVYLRVLVGQAMMDQFIKPKLDGFLADNPEIECEFESQLPHGWVSKQIEESRFDYALFHMLETAEVSEKMRQIARVSSGVYAHRSFAEGKDLPLRPEELSALPWVLPSAGSVAEQNLLASLSARGIFPEKIIGHTQYFEVMAGMIERGLGVGTVMAALFKPERKADLVMLYPLTNWHLCSFNRYGRENIYVNRLEAFMISCVLNDPNYPKIDDLGTG